MFRQILGSCCLSVVPFPWLSSIQNCCIWKSIALPNSLVSTENLSHSLKKQDVHKKFIQTKISSLAASLVTKVPKPNLACLQLGTSDFHRDSKQSYYHVHTVVAAHPLYFRSSSHTSDISNELYLLLSIDYYRHLGWLADTFVYTVDD